MFKILRYKIGVTKINTKGMANRLLLYFFSIQNPSSEYDDMETLVEGFFSFLPYSTNYFPTANN